MWSSCSQNFKNIFNKNNKFELYKNIFDILNDKSCLGNNRPLDLTSSVLEYFKRAPLTSTDVKRSFSLFKTVL